MSLYRFVRASAITSLVVKYRSKLFRIALAIAFALVTAWAYADIASFLDARHPEYLGLALIIKNLVIYAALFYGFWQFRPIIAEAKDEEEAENDSAVALDPEHERFDRLDALTNTADKPDLKSRRQAILQRKTDTDQSP